MPPPAAVRGALRERFVGHVPPLQLWQLVLTACLVATAVVLIAAGPMKVAEGLDSLLTTLEGVRASHFSRVYPLLPGPGGVPY